MSLERESHVTITSIVESKQQRTGNCKREEPHDRNHHCHPPPWAVSGVVEHGHGHSCVSGKVHTDADASRWSQGHIYFKAKAGTSYRGGTMNSHCPLNQTGAASPHFTATRIQKHVCWYVKVYLSGWQWQVCEVFFRETLVFQAQKGQIKSNIK